MTCGHRAPRVTSFRLGNSARCYGDKIRLFFTAQQQAPCLWHNFIGRGPLQKIKNANLATISVVSTANLAVLEIGGSLLRLNSKSILLVAVI